MRPTVTTVTAHNAPFGTFHHVGIVAPSDQHDQLVDDICHLLGAEVADGGTDDPLDIRWTWVAGAGSPILEVVSPLGRVQGPITRFLDRTGGGLHHLSFEAKDLDACLAHAKDVAKLPITGENPDHGGWAEFLIAPDRTSGAIFHCMEKLTGGDS